MRAVRSAVIDARRRGWGRTLEVAGVGDNDGAGLLEEVERGGHGGVQEGRGVGFCRWRPLAVYMLAGDIC